MLRLFVTPPAAIDALWAGQGQMREVALLHQLDGHLAEALPPSTTMDPWSRQGGER